MPNAMTSRARGFAVCLCGALLWSGARAAGDLGRPIDQGPAPGLVWEAAGDPPPPPPGTERVLSYDRQGRLLAACAEMPGPAVRRGVRSVPPSEVWITDGEAVWKTSMGPVTCDPAWSPSGDRLVVTALDGLWLLAGPQQKLGERLVDARAPDGQAGGDPKAIAKPRWSPNGARVAYLVSNGGTSWVEVVDVASGRVLWRSQEETYGFTWGADSRSLVIGANTVRVP